jgi:hypothetical protein
MAPPRARVMMAPQLALELIAPPRARVMMAPQLALELIAPPRARVIMAPQLALELIAPPRVQRQFLLRAYYGFMLASFTMSKAGIGLCCSLAAAGPPLTMVVFSASFQYALELALALGMAHDSFRRLGVDHSSIGVFPPVRRACVRAYGKIPFGHNDTRPRVSAA